MDQAIAGGQRRGRQQHGQETQRHVHRHGRQRARCQ
jgi:hypothetical protein